MCCYQALSDAEGEPYIHKPDMTNFSQTSEPKEIGRFTNIFHDIAGTAFALDEKTIVIKDFNYDGEVK